MINRTNPFNETDDQTRPSPFATLLESALDYIRPRRGEVREASILAIGDNDMIVDLDGKRDGIIPPSDLDNVHEEYVQNLNVGDKVPVQIIKESSHANGIIVSLKKGLEQQDWIRAEKMLDSGDTFEAEVTDVNRGGVLVNFGRLQAFVPNSHLTSVPMGLKRDAFREAKEELVGKTLTLSVIEVKQRRRRLIASERAARKQKREQLLEELAEGDIRSGLVRNIVDFGVFVDLGGIDGLIHISELDWEYVKDPNNVLSVGDEVEVYVLNVDRERERIALSRKRVIPVSQAE
ncbi:MAG: S1 RNA-binding domain-containing protein [Anaerolineales bacterium]